MLYEFFDKKTSVGAIKNRIMSIMSNKEWAEELHKPIIRKSKKRKVYSSFIDNIWGADLGDMQLISKFNKSNCFLLYVIDIFSKYICVIPLKDKKKYYNSAVILGTADSIRKIQKGHIFTTKKLKKAPLTWTPSKIIAFSQLFW